MGMLRRISCVLIAGLCWGCFVFDEIDAGQKWMDDHSPNAERRGEEAPPATALASARKPKSEPGMGDKLKQWWAKVTEPPPPPPDPNDVIVRCQLGAATHFTRKNECLLRGGKVI
jgi:hypothetical protein